MDSEFEKLAQSHDPKQPKCESNIPTGIAAAKLKSPLPQLKANRNWEQRIDEYN